MIKIPLELKELAQIFKRNGSTLYIVGGFVRDSYLNLSSSLRNDIDICADVPPKKLAKILEDTEFKIKPLNEDLGVMAIYGKRRYEYATFRREVYESESHTPEKVEFIKKIEEDALRRDFKINAIYFDILEGEYVDPLGGIDDLREKKITTTRPPKIVFNDDPERILRLIRFACTIGLNIPDDEMFYAKQNSYKIKFISKQRLKNEFDLLLNADQIYPDVVYTKNAHFRAMVLLGEIDAWKWILPAVDEFMRVGITDFKGERIYEHVLNCLIEASPKIRLAVLLHDAGKFKSMEIQRSFFGSTEWVGVIVEKNLGINGLGYPKQIVEDTKKIIIGYDFNAKGLASPGQVRKFILDNKEVIDDIIEIKEVVKNEGKIKSKNVFSAQILRKKYNEMKKTNTPFSVQEMAIKGSEIIVAFPKIKLETIENLLQKMLDRVVTKGIKNNKEALLRVANRLIKSKRNFYLEQ